MLAQPQFHLFDFARIHGRRLAGGTKATASNSPRQVTIEYTAVSLGPSSPSGVESLISEITVLIAASWPVPALITPTNMPTAGVADGLAEINLNTMRGTSQNDAAISAIDASRSRSSCR